MGEQDRNLRGRSHRNDELDRALDAALAKYAAIEPRAGLEERVLANLHAEHIRRIDHAWWRWGLGTMAVAVLVLTVAWVWRSGRPAQPRIANERPVAKQDLPKSGAQVAGQDGNAVRPRPPHPLRSTSAHPAHSAVVVSDGPKLDQFPSPQPLSDQEKILANYVSEYPEHAALIAQARMEMLQRDQEEELRVPGVDRKEDSQPQ
jgi:hypothetical protein